jgi:hypothetical protein
MVRHSTLPLLAFLLVTLASLAEIASAQVPATNDATAEDAFLEILPRLDLPEVLEPIPGVVNEAFRSCRAFWPAGYTDAQTGPEARPLRDIYGLVRVRNVLVTKDCTCPGKVANWSDVEAIASALRKAKNSSQLGWRDTVRISDEADRLTVFAETLCGGDF